MSGLDELRVPPPVQTPDEEDGRGSAHPGRPSAELHLEDEPVDSDENFEVGEDSAQGPNQQPRTDAAKPSKSHKLLTELYIISHLIFFSLLGTLARLGIQWLTFYPGAPVTTSVLWANVGGSYVMGFLSEDRQLFQFPASLQKPNMTSADTKAQHAKHKKTIPLYIGLATGFCGSFTSFSSFMRDAFLALSNDLPSPLSHPIPANTAPPNLSTTHPRHNGYSVLSLLAVLLYEPALSLCALYVGAHTALLLDRATPSISPRTNCLLDRLALPLGFGAWLAALLIAIFPTNPSWRGEVLFALVFAPLGTLLRFYASLRLNPVAKSFPLGTFAVNVFGSAVLGMAFDLQRVRIRGLTGGSVAGCQVLQGIEDGFCGCLTTVSTWVAEIQGLRRRHAYRYALVSMAAGMAVMVLIMGSVRWSVGWNLPICVTSRTSS
ncbi:putative fluoride export protein [Elsinoe australis]|uniref:Putative fluoride export protein n=1 Tax=Elsinoe australis TaxID=40998 RepID=A0A4U7AYU2_9PEZI|nr:putative fluoride export protein [Elsinoe australis]